MKKPKTRTEIMNALEKGKRITSTKWDKDQFIYMKAGNLCNADHHILYDDEVEEVLGCLLYFYPIESIIILD